jgi:hypothetical protein
MFEIEREVRTGETQHIGEYDVTPQTDMFFVRLRGLHGGLIWNRQKAVIVRTNDGEESILPVQDVTATSSGHIGGSGQC